MHPAILPLAIGQGKEIKENLYQPLYFIVITLFFLFYQFFLQPFIDKTRQGDEASILGI